MIPLSINNTLGVQALSVPASRADDLLAHLRAVVMLAGTVRSSRLMTGIRRSVLDLPVDNGVSLLAHWSEVLNDLASALEIPRLTWRILVSRGSRRPEVGLSDKHRSLALSIEEDPAEFRGTGGVLRDIADAYADDDVLLVAAGPQLLLESLTEVLRTLARPSADLSVLSYVDGTPSGLMLARCAVLKKIRAVGFVDLKEQALPQLAQTHRLEVVVAQHTSGVPIRTLESYIHGVRRYHRKKTGANDLDNPWAEDWEPNFSIIEPGATIGPGAVVQDAVVLRGATVGKGALVLRSVVGPGGQVDDQARVVGTVVEPVTKDIQP